MKKRLNQTENTVHRLERKRDELQNALADPELYEGDGSPAEVQKKLGRVEKDLQAAEDDWTALQEEWDRASERMEGP